MNIEGNTQYLYENIDKETETSTDHQLDLDIPRCHQYNDVFSSLPGRLKLKRCLKAWLAEETDLCYWQGLDSLCAVFVSVNYDDEALAYACFKAFVRTFHLDKFFVQDNSIAIQVWMDSLQKLLTFHDVDLSLHMINSGLLPELYAIPWFMTSFSHVLQVDKLFHLFDTYLVGPSYPQLYTAFAILKQLKDSLMHQDFNSMMTVFSELPTFEIEDISYTIFRTAYSTPPSLLYQLSEIGGILDIRKEEELAGRISAEDFILMRPYSLVLDCCDSEKFSDAHIPNSLSVSSENLKMLIVSLKMQFTHCKYVVVVCYDDIIGAEISNVLVKVARFNQVCIMNAAGIELEVCNCLTVKTGLGLTKCSVSS